MKLPPLERGTLLRRYKRFLADIRLETGELITAHCPNSGSMRSCSDPGSPVMVSKSENLHRRYAHTWELVFANNVWVGINTLVPNRLVYEAIRAGQFSELHGVTGIQKEVKYGKNSRIDLLLSFPDRLCYVEVKNVTLVERDIAYFPDAVTERGRKHLQELVEMVAQRHRAVMFHLVQREDARLFRPAEHIDPMYAKSLRSAAEKGVEVLVYQAKVTPEEIKMGKPLPYQL